MNAPHDLLIVDDDPTVIVVVGACLRSLGKVRFAKRGADGLRLARQAIPNLVLLDLNLPDLPGLQLLAEMRASAPLATVPVLLMSGSEPDARVQAWCEQPGVAFQMKPPQPQRLLACAQALLQAAADGGVVPRRRGEDAA
ncbi:MAG: response regulator [Aquincola tertiaricarbonis]|uniref:response regulator n=1 Tax=Aquincola TaxID=391952 RepID=UPI0006990D89|nr:MULTISPECIES: response regulator [Aquincola]MCR5865004.1 response regulator [Aquincola sp. J276]